MNTVSIWCPAGEQHAVGGGWFTQPRQFVDRKEFQNLLVEMLEENNIELCGLKRKITTAVSCAAWSWWGDDGGAEITVMKLLKGEV